MSVSKPSRAPFAQDVVPHTASQQRHRANQTSSLKPVVGNSGALRLQNLQRVNPVRTVQIGAPIDRSKCDDALCSTSIVEPPTRRRRIVNASLVAPTSSSTK